MLMTLRSNGIFPDQQNTSSFNNYSTNSSQIAETVVQYTEEPPLHNASPGRTRVQYSPSSTGTGTFAASQRSKQAARRRSPPQMNGLLGNAPQPLIYVRALYDYEADDRTSLSFHEGDVIQVITQLESGWWDGVINGVRGWFPSNYCQIISADEVENKQNGMNGDQSEEDAEDEDEYTEEEEDQYDEDEADSERDDMTQLPMEGTDNSERTRADFWIPQATPDGRLFYFNTDTGESRSEMPLESPSSATENGPRDRMNVNIPEKTRPPPEMMARGYMQDEEDDESEGNSASELEGESLMLASRNSYPRKRRSQVSDGVSPATSMDSMNGMSPITRSRADQFTNPTLSMVPAMTMMGPSTTSFTNPSLGPPHAATLPRSFFDDGTSAPLTWNRLVANMKKAVDRYREAINNRDRSEYVRRAEDISDHLRLLLAAGSGTTDNHSGQPSIISSNKALYPHFRDMMSKFSKLVISSHIAAADWPNAESFQKCLQEADGVLQGVFSYVEVARQQRGEDIPRLLPGFVIGSTSGGSWQNNGLGSRDPLTSNFLDEDEALVEPSAILDANLMERLDDLKRMLISSIRKLEEHLVVTEKIITPYRHEIIGNNVCTAAKKVLEMFKPWVSTVESINLSSLGNSFQNPQLVDFAAYKQSLYDNISDLILGCQTVAGPLGDEWAEVRGESLDGRLNYVRQCAKQLETNASHIGFSLQLLGEQVQMATQQETQSPPPRDDARPRRADSTPYERSHARTDSRLNTVLRPGLAGIAQSQSYSEGDPAANYRKGENSKVRKFFGEEPTRRDQVRDAQPQDETPDCLKLDHEDDISYDFKVQPPQLKGGTLVALVEQLTRHDKLESSFNNTFLLTYRSFTTARELFELLVVRFQIQPPEGMAQSDYEIWRDRKQKPIRFRVVNILKSWFDNFWMEDQSDETKALIRDVYTFARDTVKTTETPGSGPLMTVLEQRLRGQDTTAKRLVLTLNQSTPQPIMPKNMKKLKFLDIDVTEFARQLTIVESKLYGKIKPTECLNKTWQKKVGEGDPEPAPNVKALILHSNQLTNWVAEMILTQLDVKKRVVVIKHFVLVADKCRQLNNYSTLTSIISALGTAPIHRLKRTWDQVPAKTTAVLESMRRLMGSTKNFGEYRESLHLANPPCIPFFGVYLTDLTFIEDGIPSIIKKSALINFAKRAKTAEVIRDIQQYQNVPYPLQPVPELQEYILSNMQAAGDVHEMYEKSLAVEPREREDEKIVRYVRLLDLPTTGAYSVV
ncbi:cell division control protein-like protein Cdc25 [Mollisia scopiformis]|uniref:Class E vacuolar protein-sorting machinery protein HSE1 n=1 Tax=Mollisia scopiformis TaxID=149040 RepID=A0A132BBZ5_MOLSC|nr:cell division control protein-like protein Cdc25 [Mollisia scopiformis]KUJ09916.1 cell division control protein-like protein Cdc25 [Mollisia scopiformis]